MAGHGSDQVVVGQIGPARGVRGDLFVRPWTDDPDARFSPGTVLSTDPADAGPLTVAEANSAGGKMVVRFEGVDDRAAAERLRGVRLVMPAGERPELDDPDDYYTDQLVGLAARTVAGQALGDVVDVVQIAGADYLVVSVDGRDRLIPFVAAIVPRVDLPAGTVEIDPPEGLLEL
jgi:16S rRNA processing protein RimM